MPDERYRARESSGQSLLLLSRSGRNLRVLGRQLVQQAVLVREDAVVANVALVLDGEGVGRAISVETDGEFGWRRRQAAQSGKRHVVVRQFCDAGFGGIDLPSERERVLPTRPIRSGFSLIVPAGDGS